MDSLGEIAITCDDGSDFNSAVQRAQMSVSVEIRAQFVELFTSLVVQHGYAEAFERVHGRRISDLIRESPDAESSPMVRGTLDGTTYEFYRAPSEGTP
jgi:hypothetical protein